MNARPISFLVLVTLLLPGCAAGPEVEPHQPAAVTDHYRVESTIEWTRIERGKLEVWTVDGPQLQQLRFYRAVHDGNSLLPRPPPTAAGPDRRPRYQAWMRPHDIMDLVAASLSQSGAISVATRNLRPADFGQREGFRFDLAFESQGGLDYRGLALGMVDAEHRLHLILYTGTRSHYFEAYRGPVEDILASIELL